jgi:hypothetical protein
MPTPREITYPIALSRAELAFMLNLLEVRQLIGVDDEALFPHEPAARDALFSAGKAGLEAAGWLSWQAEQKAYHLDEVLLAICVALAFPQVVATLVLDAPPAPRRGVTCAVSSDLVVELAHTDGQYQINALASVELLAQRLAHVLDLPQQHGTGESHSLARSAFEALRNDPHSSAGCDGLPTAVAERLAATLASLTCSAVISLLQVHESQVADLRLIGVLVGQTGDAWMVLPAGDAHVQIRAVGKEDVAVTLTSTIADLRPAP